MVINLKLISILRQIDKEIKTFKKKYNELIITHENLQSMQRKITLLEHEITELTKDRQFLEKETNKKYDKQEQLTNQLMSELTNLSTKIKERETYVSKIVKEYNKTNKLFHIIPQHHLQL